MWVKNIAILVWAAVFLLSSTGVVIFQANCLCTGNETVSLYVTPETCNNDFHPLHQHGSTNATDKEDECTGCCPAPANECGCPAPEFKYFKLLDHLTNHEVKYVKLLTHPLVLARQLDFCLQLNDLAQTTEEKHFYTEPPPTKQSSLDFLILLQQLKIPDAA